MLTCWLANYWDSSSALESIGMLQSVLRRPRGLMSVFLCRLSTALLLRAGFVSTQRGKLLKSLYSDSDWAQKI